MARSTKVTFTLDDATIARLSNAAQRLAIPKSEVVREAIQEYHARIGRLSEAERRRMLADFDRLVPLIPSRPEGEVKRELENIRKARRRGGRKRMERHRP
jgi:predicted transcriptional regulator